MEMELNKFSDELKCIVFHMVMLPSHKLLIADTLNKEVRVLDIQAERQISHLQLPGMPFRLCVLPGDRAAVAYTDVKAIQILDVNSDELKLLKRVRIVGILRGLAYQNNRFVVGYSRPAYVALLNNEGKHFKSLSKDYAGQDLFRNIRDICVTTEEKNPTIYVADNITRTITRLSETLEVLQTFTLKNQYAPHGLAATGGGQLLVTGRNFLQPDKLFVLDTNTGVFDELLEVAWQGVDVFSAGPVAFCPRLGHVYLRTGQGSINVYQIS